MKRIILILFLFIVTDTIAIETSQIMDKDDIIYSYIDPKQKNLLTTVLEKSPEQLNTYLTEQAPHLEKIINAGIVAKTPYLINDKREVRCTTVMNELLLRTPQNQSLILKLNCLLDHGYNPSITVGHYVPYLGRFELSSLPLSNAIITGNSLAVALLLKSVEQPNPKIIDPASGHTPLELLQLCINNSSSIEEQNTDGTLLAPPVPAFKYELVYQIVVNYLKEHPNPDQD